jgi:hypothetical protein
MGKLLAVLLVFVFSGLCSQNSAKEVHLYATEVYGSDDLLINGSVYYPLHPVAFGDPFLIENQFHKAHLVLQGREFNDVLLKFDVEQQKLILKGFLDSLKFEIIVLADSYVKEFYFHNRHFVNISNLLETNSQKGFYELIYDGDFVFVKQYEKEFLAMYSNRYPHGKYSQTKVEKFIIKDNMKFKINNKKSLYSIFPDKKILIRKFMKDQKIKLRKASNESLNLLMKYIDEVSD